ncbi:hypothetical protein XENTR_v10000507 [Xenopus tropicalis]|nr:hypothetical protein XENTR_v10000507 [Xenopus tropicalis]
MEKEAKKKQKAKKKLKRITHHPVRHREEKSSSSSSWEPDSPDSGDDMDVSLGSSLKTLCVIGKCVGRCLLKTPKIYKFLKGKVKYLKKLKKILVKVAGICKKIDWSKIMKKTKRIRHAIGCTKGNMKKAWKLSKTAGKKTYKMCKKIHVTQRAKQCYRCSKKTIKFCIKCWKKIPVKQIIEMCQQCAQTCAKTAETMA